MPKLKHLASVALVAILCGCGNATVSTPAPPVPLDAQIAARISDARNALRAAQVFCNCSTVATNNDPKQPIFPAMREPLNTIYYAEQAVEHSFTTYEADFKAGKNPDPAQLNADIVKTVADIAALVARFKGAK